MTETYWHMYQPMKHKKSGCFPLLKGWSSTGAPPMQAATPLGRSFPMPQAQQQQQPPPRTGFQPPSPAAPKQAQEPLPQRVEAHGALLRPSHMPCLHGRYLVQTQALETLSISASASCHLTYGTMTQPCAICKPHLFLVNTLLPFPYS